MAKTIKDLSVPQLLILTSAAGRPDRMVMPLPSTPPARGASQQRLLSSLLRLLLVEAVVTDTLILSWRHDEQGQYYALQLTTAGSIAVAATIEPESVRPVAGPIVGEVVAIAETATGAATDNGADVAGPVSQCSPTA